jgi:hypothetical protein
MPPNHLLVHIPDEDIATMRQHPTIASDEAAMKLAHDISMRLHTEGHLSREQTMDRTPVNDAYTAWRDREVYFALRREDSDGSNGAYERIREKVILAIVQRAREVFAEWEGQWSPMLTQPRSTSRTNLRTSLEPYMESIEG